jgi:hypothetical protein
LRRLLVFCLLVSDVEIDGEASGKDGCGWLVYAWF